MVELVEMAELAELAVSAEPAEPAEPVVAAFAVDFGYEHYFLTLVALEQAVHELDLKEIEVE